MKQFLGVLLACCLGIAGVAGSAGAQELSHIDLINTGNQPVYIVAYDPLCRIRVFEGVLVEGSNRTVSICANNRGLSTVIIYDVHGRGVRYSKIRNGGDVNIRIRRSDFR